MSALPPKADIGTQPLDVRFVPKADIARCSKTLPIRSPRPSSVRGTLRPSALAVFRLIISSHLFGIERSAPSHKRSFWQSRFSQAIDKVITVFCTFKNRYVFLRPDCVFRVHP